MGSSELDGKSEDGGGGEAHHVPKQWAQMTEQIVKLLSANDCGPLDCFGIIFFVLGYMANRYANEHQSPALNEMAEKIAGIQGTAMVKMNPRLLSAMASGAVFQLADGHKLINRKGGMA